MWESEAAPKLAVAPDAAAAPDPSHWVVRLGRALHAAGSPSHRVEEGMELAARRLGIRGAAFLGALLVGAAGNLLARLLHRPAALLQVPGLILLVPGSLGFRSLSSLLHRDVLSGVHTAFEMTLVAIALTTGLLLAGVVVPPRRAL